MIISQNEITSLYSEVPLQRNSVVYLHLSYPIEELLSMWRNVHAEGLNLRLPCFHAPLQPLPHLVEVDREVRGGWSHFRGGGREDGNVYEVAEVDDVHTAW